MEPTTNPILGNSFFNSSYLNPDYLFSRGVEFFHRAFDFTSANGRDFLSIFHNLLFLLSFFFLTIIFYCVVRMFEIRKKEHEHLHHEIHEYVHHQKELEKKKEEGGDVSKNPRWLSTLAYLFSQYKSDWKLAVIEADGMLEKLLDQLGFKGETLGDKLKSADPARFKSLSLAWEMHTIRNRIAHEGMAFELSQHEAKRVIAIYESIFREYGFI